MDANPHKSISSINLKISVARNQVLSQDTRESSCPGTSLSQAPDSRFPQAHIIVVDYRSNRLKYFIGNHTTLCRKETLVSDRFATILRAFGNDSIYFLAIPSERIKRDTAIKLYLEASRISLQNLLKIFD